MHRPKQFDPTRAASLLGLTTADAGGADKAATENGDAKAGVRKQASELKKMLGFDEDAAGSGADDSDEDEPSLPTFDPRNIKTVPLTKYQNLEGILADEREHRRRASEALRSMQEQFEMLQATSRQQLSLLRKELESLSSKQGNGTGGFSPETIAALRATAAESASATEETLRKLRIEHDEARQRIQDLEAALRDSGKGAAAPAPVANGISRRADDAELRRAHEDADLLRAENKSLRAQSEANQSRASAAESSLAKAATELESLRSLAARMQSSASRQAGMRLAIKALCPQLRSLQGARDALVAEVSALRSEVDSVTETLRAGMANAVRMAGSGLEDVMAKYKKEAKERKKLFNQLQEMKGNIRVFCRVRPLTQMELDRTHNNTSTCSFVDDDELCLTSDRMTKSFEFDRVFRPHESQEEVFKDTLPLVTSVVDGYNVCIFAYGQTGSGKTHTMEGPAEDPGVNTRALGELFRICSARSDEYEFEILASVLEIYNENIRDLLDKSSSPPKLEVRQTPTGFWVPELVQRPVTSIKDVEKLMAVGKANRTTFSTNLNEHSSRSHSLLSIHVNSKNKVSGITSLGRLHLVDLAGSERVSRSEAAGDRLKEAQAINKSLSALGDVIAALASKAAHIPYRNSKLTHLLQDSLSGDSKTLMFVQVSPAVDNAQESLCSLNFATRVRNVELGQARKHTEGGADELAKYKKMVAALQARLEAAEGGSAHGGSGGAGSGPSTPSRNVKSAGSFNTRSGKA